MTSGWFLPAAIEDNDSGTTTICGGVITDVTVVARLPVRWDSKRGRIWPHSALQDSTEEREVDNGR